MLISRFSFQMKPESKGDCKLSEVRTPGLLCHFLHKPMFQSSASLQDFYVSGLISVLHYCERHHVITMKFWNAPKEHCEGKCQHRHHICNSPTPHTLFPCSWEPTRAGTKLCCSSSRCCSCPRPSKAHAALHTAPLMSSRHYTRKKRMTIFRMQQMSVAAEYPGTISPCWWLSSPCPALWQLGGGEQRGDPLPPPHTSCNLWLTCSSQSALLARYRNTSRTENEVAAGFTTSIKTCSLLLPSGRSAQASIQSMQHVCPSKY